MRGYFLIITSIASAVFLRVVCAVILIIVIIANFVFLWVACAVIFNYYYYCEFCVLGGVR